MNLQSDHGYSTGFGPCIACGASHTFCCNGKGKPWSERYRGVKILFDRQDGFHAEYGNEGFGYCDALEDIKAEIDDYMAGPDDARARQAIGWE